MVEGCGSRTVQLRRVGFFLFLLFSAKGGGTARYCWLRRLGWNSRNLSTNSMNAG